MEVEVDAFVRGDLDTCEHAAVVGPVIAVMEQADVPLRADGLQELEQRAGSLGEFESEQSFVGEIAWMTADHVAHMELCHFVVAEVGDRIALLAQ